MANTKVRVTRRLRWFPDVPAMLIMALILVGLFNSYRKPLIIVLIIPFAMIGVTMGLLITRQPFGFVALLAAMSLAGMMVKNAIVLVDEIDALQAAGQAPFDAVINAAVSLCDRCCLPPPQLYQA